MLRFPNALLALLVLAAAPAQDRAGPEPAPAAPGNPVVALLGASLTAGFADPKPLPNGERNETVRLARVLAELWPERKVELKAADGRMLPMFTNPTVLGAQQVERMLETEPELVVAVDFLFWYGYGVMRTGPDGDDVAPRVSRLEQGLAELAKFACPVVAGDFPDMTGADPRMLHPRQIPSAAALAKLNERLHAWAAERKNVRLFPLADFVRDAKGDGIEVELDGQDHRLRAAELLQGDRLHPTTLGMALLGQRIAELLAAALPKDAALRPEPVELAELAEDLGAGIALEDLRRRAGAKPQPAGTGRDRR
jgi:hypothetical protein